MGAQGWNINKIMWLLCPGGCDGVRLALSGVGLEKSCEVYRCVMAGCLAHCWVLEQQRKLLVLVSRTQPTGHCVTHIFVCSVVGECVVGLLFENYIVNASIFIKKQFL